MGRRSWYRTVAVRGWPRRLQPGCVLSRMKYEDDRAAYAWRPSSAAGAPGRTRAVIGGCCGNGGVSAASAGRSIVRERIGADDQRVHLVRRLARRGGGLVDDHEDRGTLGAQRPG